MIGHLLEAALGYASRGWPVFPVKKNKTPRTAHGLKDATTDADQIRQLWALWPDAGVAIRTGEGLLVLDVDGEDGEESLHRLEREHGELPETVRCVTGSGGAHYYFRGSARNSVGKLGAGLDIRADGGYAVAPPSPHSNGRRYEWDLPPDEAELATAPAWLLEGETERRNGPAPEVAEEIPEHQRNNTLTSLAGSMRRRGMDQEEILVALKAVNKRRCRPPLEDGELEQIAGSVARYAPARTENDRTHRTLDEKPAKSGGKSVRSPTEHPPNTAEQPIPDLTFEPSILDHFDRLMGRLGLIGERATARATYLVHISRLLEKPAREVVKGDSSTGKSFASECALAAAAQEETYVRTQASPLALFYSEQDFQHKTIVFFEANKLGDDEDPLANVLRTLLSEGKLAYEVTDPRTHSTKYLEKTGPVAFITTTCRAKLDAEIETRILSLHSNGSDEQTKAVVRAIIEGADDIPAKPKLDGWHELDRWLRDGPRKVVIPWAKALASFELSGPPRLRRDVQNLLSLVRAHALLHRGTRNTDGRDRIVATLDDYEVVSTLLAEAMAVATDRAVRQGTREVVEAVIRLREAEPEKKVPMRAAQREAGRSSSTTHTDVHDALDRGYLVNRSESRSFDLDEGDPLPDQEDLLPSREELEARVKEMFGDVREVFGTRPNTQSRTQNQESPSVRSVRSNTGQGGEVADGDG